MKNTKWNPDQYEKFIVQRTKPFHDLKNLIQAESIRNAIDLGCGTGKLTRNLCDAFKPAKMKGIDSSPSMLRDAKKFETQELTFQHEDISTHAPVERYDLVFSNAALQWLPDHEVLFPKILNWVEDYGQVAIQMPFNFDHPSHRLAGEVAHRLFPLLFEAPRQAQVLSLQRYAEILFQNGFENQIARLEIYGHAMDSGKDVIEWTKGTLLTGYQSKLDEAQFSEFLNTYETELIQEIGEGPYFYAFKRALLWGRKRP